MTNRLKGEVPLPLPDGRKFTLVLNHEALIAAEGLYGKPLGQTLVDVYQGFAGALRALLWAALQANHKDVTLAEAAQLVFDHGETVASALNAATEAASPDADPSAEGKARKPQGGKNSGGNGAKPGSTRKASGKRPRAPSR